nr:MAG TPA: hypothetical protein [Caudoviricetes sp.]
MQVITTDYKIIVDSVNKAGLHSHCQLNTVRNER